MHPQNVLHSPAQTALVKQEICEIGKSPLFRQAPKLKHLLEYVCNKALLQEGDTVTEYTIAIDVFGKAPDFKDRKDSSVRVEVHRLRKRLAQYYESDGRHRPMRIMLPQGHYCPEFVLFAPSADQSAGPPSLPEPPAPITEPVLESPPVLISERPSEPKIAVRSTVKPKRVLLVGSIIGLLVTLLAGAWLYWGRALEPNRRMSATANLPSQDVSRVGPSVLSAFEPIRIMAGYSGPPVRDFSGVEWQPDRFFISGRPSHVDVSHVGRTSDPRLYQNARIGDSAYEIPLPQGVYEIHLYFMEPEFGPEVGRGENDRTFFLHLNDWRVTPAIDIESDAMGPNIADERVFKDVRPASDGKLHLSLESATGVPMINAIEILPGVAHKQLPIRIVTQRVPFTDHLGQVWQSDRYYFNGQTCPRNQVVAATPDPALYTMERYGHFDYAIPVDVRGQYTVRLHFAESYFGPTSSGRGGVGSRVFNVTCDGLLLFPNLDIFNEAGSGRALIKTAYHIKSTAQGKLNLTFEPVVNYALINGIEVLDESR